MEAVLHVDKLAYCKLEIEDSNMPPSMNLIDNIMIQEGMGIAIPTLTLRLMDQTGTLQTDMNLVQGTKCSISIAKRGTEDQIIKRNFSLWGMKRGVTEAGPHIHAVFTMDVPKWIAGVYCENFRATSDEAMAQMAGSSGLRYDGPDSTDDMMNWLNVNTTRSSFSEDVAMRGYASNTSCMNRVVTMDSDLRYKDLYKQMQEEPVATFLLNTDHEGQNNPYYVQETQESSSSGAMAHWFNFGQIQHEHTLDQKGQQITDRILAPILGDAFPISDRVKGLISDAVAARVTYTGFDPGTEPNPGSNVHENYERAFYQNLRSLGLFSERLRSLVTTFTEIKTFDCIEYKQNDPAGNQLIPSKTLNGKYLVAGKTIVIKNGHSYSETFDLIRPYVSNPGESEQASGTDSNKQVEANANEDLSSEKETEIGAALNNQETPAESESDIAPEVDRSIELMEAVDEFDKANPRMPEEPSKTPGSMSPSDKQAVAQDRLRKALTEINRDDNPVARKIAESNQGFDPETSHTVKRVSAAAVKTSANETVDALKKHKEDTGTPASGPEGLSANAKAKTKVTLEKPILDRYSGTGTEIKEEKFTSVVTPESAEGIQEGDNIGDVQKGGTFAQDFQEKGREVPQNVENAKTVSAKEQEDNKGGAFVFQASKFGLGGEDVRIKPAEVGKFLVELYEERDDPQAFLKEKGPAAYEATFGAKQPKDAKSAAEEVKRVSGNVQKNWGPDEVIAEPGPGSDTPGYSIAEGRRRNAKEFSDGGPSTQTPNFSANDPRKGQEKEESFTDKAANAKKRNEAIKQELDKGNTGVTIKDSTTGLDFGATTNMSGVTQIAKDSIKQKKKGGPDPDYAQAFDFQFGEAGVSPLVERVSKKDKDEGFTEYEKIQTKREAKSWADYMRIGSNEAKQQQKADPEKDGVYWEFPEGVPFKKMEEGEGEANDLPDTPGAI